MIPVLHLKAATFEEEVSPLLEGDVAWTETREIAIDKPLAACRVMDATVLDQARLKTAAGIKATGRKLAAAAMHLTLSWHPSEAAALTREEMTRAVNGATKALEATDRQALIVCPITDKDHPHLHVFINRVSPADGRTLPSYNNHRALSRWAKGYEQDRGQLLCERRDQMRGARERRGRDNERSR